MMTTWFPWGVFFVLVSGCSETVRADKAPASQPAAAASQPASMPAPAPSANIQFEIAFGTSLLTQPIGIASLGGGLLAVSDAERNVIEVFDEDGKHIRSLKPADGLERPMHIDSAGGKLWVAEYAADRVTELTFTGEATGSTITADFDAPGGVVVTKSGTKYVADFYNHQVAVIDAAGKSRRWGSAKGSLFTYPTDVALSPDESIVYVADAYAHRVRAFSVDGKELRSWGGQGSEPGQFNVATGITTCGAGNIYVADFENHRVQVFGRDGVLQAVFGKHGSGDGQLDHPTDLVIVGNKLFVVDYGNHRIQRFVWL